MAPLFIALELNGSCSRPAALTGARPAGLPALEEVAGRQLHQEQGEQDHPDAEPLASVQCFPTISTPQETATMGLVRASMPITSGPWRLSPTARPSRPAPC